MNLNRRKLRCNYKLFFFKLILSKVWILVIIHSFYLHWSITLDKLQAPAFQDHLSPLERPRKSPLDLLAFQAINVKSTERQCRRFRRFFRRVEEQSSVVQSLAAPAGCSLV